MTKSKDVIDPNWPTIFELASQIPYMDLSVPGQGKKNRPSVAQGLVPEPFPIDKPYFFASVPQILSLRVPILEIDGGIRGFQRGKGIHHAREIARAINAGKEMPPALISVFPDGLAYIGEGQHRALGAVIAQMPLECVVKKRAVADARELFSNQTKAKNVKTDNTLLTGNSPLEIYIQDALTTDKHLWSDMVGLQASDLRMSPTTMANIVGAYVFNALHNGVRSFVSKPESQWDEKYANELARLIQPFGTKVTNPLAFRGNPLRAISYAAVWIIRRNPAWRGDKDFERWRAHMPKFDFAKYPHILNKEHDLAHEMVRHWNKRLPEARLVRPNSLV